MVDEPNNETGTSSRWLTCRAAIAVALLSGAAMALLWPRQPLHVRCTLIAAAVAADPKARCEVKETQQRVQRLATLCGLPTATVRTSGSEAELHICIVAEGQSVGYLQRSMQALQAMLVELASAGQFHLTTRTLEQPAIWSTWKTAYRKITELTSTGGHQWEVAARRVAEAWAEHGAVRESVVEAAHAGQETTGRSSIDDKLAARIAELERQLDGLLATRTEQHPQVRQVREELSQLLASAAPVYASHRAAEQDAVAWPAHSVAQQPTPPQLSADEEFRQCLEALVSCGKDCLQRLQYELDWFDEQMRQWHAKSPQLVGAPSRLVVRPLKFTYHGGLTAVDWSLIVASSMAVAILVYLPIRCWERHVVCAPAQLSCRLSWPVWSVIGRRPLTSCLLSLLSRIDRALIWLVGGVLLWFFVMQLLDRHFVFHFLCDPGWAIYEKFRCAVSTVG